MDPRDLFQQLGGTGADAFPPIHSEALHTDARHAVPAARGRRPAREAAGGAGGDASVPRRVRSTSSTSPSTSTTRPPLTAGGAAAQDRGPDLLRELRPPAHVQREREAVLRRTCRPRATARCTSTRCSRSCCYGISRSNTHEIVRHRAGTAFSQLSQRFVSGQGAALRRASRVPATTPRCTSASRSASIARRGSTRRSRTNCCRCSRTAISCCPRRRRPTGASACSRRRDRCCRTRPRRSSCCRRTSGRGGT